MRRIMILNFFIVGIIFSSFAQKTIETYDINEDKQTTVILRDSSKSDKDILSELDLDDYTVGEEVYITAEMWKKMQPEKEPKAIAVEQKITKKRERTTGHNQNISSSKVKKKKKKTKRYRVKKPKRKKYISRKGKMACYRF